MFDQGEQFTRDTQLYVAAIVSLIVISAALLSLVIVQLRRWLLDARAVASES